MGLDYHEVNLFERSDHIEQLDRSFLINLHKMKKLERIQRQMRRKVFGYDS